MTALTDGFKDVFLAGVGAMALGAEKSKELVDQLIAKGEITVEQGKEINAELTQRVGAAADQAAATAQADAADFATTLKHASSSLPRRPKSPLATTPPAPRRSLRLPSPQTRSRKRPIPTSMGWKATRRRYRSLLS